MENKIKLTLLIILFSVGFTSAQSTNFFKSYGGNEFDYGQGVVQLPDSGYAVTGASGSFDNSSQAFLLRTDSLGNFKWSRNYGGPESDWGKRVFYKPTQGFWIAGYTNSFGDGDFNFFLLKTDLSGNKEWEKTYGTSDLEELNDAVILPDSGFVMVGKTEGMLSLNEDIYIVRTAFNGDTLWTKRIQTPKTDIAYSCLLQNDSTILIGGISSKTGSDETAYLTSLKLDGTTNWEKWYDTDGKATIKDIDTLNGNIYLAGGIILKDSTDKDYWLTRTDADGNFLDKRIENHPLDEYISTICTRNNLVYITNITKDSTLFIYPGGPDMILMNYTAINPVWYGYSKSFSGIGPDYTAQSIRTSDGGMALVGYASDPDFTNGGSGITLIKIGANDEATKIANDTTEFLATHEETDAQSLIQLYPNPVKNQLHIQLSSSSKITAYQISDIYGNIIQKGEVQSTIDMHVLAKGIYLLTFISPSSQRTVKILKE